jgi:hypothetical protein
MGGVETTRDSVARLSLRRGPTLTGAQRDVEADDQPTPCGLAVVQVRAGRDARIDAGRHAHPNLGLGVDDREAQDPLAQRRTGLYAGPISGRAQTQALRTAILHNAREPSAACVRGVTRVEGDARVRGRGQAHGLALGVESADLGGVAAAAFDWKAGLGS